MLRSPQNRYFCWRFKIKYFTITMLLYMYSILCEVVNTKQDNHLTPFWRLKRVFNAWTACLVFMMEWWRFMLLSTSELFLADRMFWKSISWDPAILSAVVVAGTNSNRITQFNVITNLETKYCWNTKLQLNRVTSMGLENTYLY